MSVEQDSLARVQAELGVEFPEELFDQYMVGDGLKGPLDCDLLYCLDELKSANRLKEAEWYPDKLKHLLLIGADGAGGWIAYDPATGSGVLWYPADGVCFQETRPSVADLWERIAELYENEI